MGKHARDRQEGGKSTFSNSDNHLFTETSTLPSCHPATQLNTRTSELKRASVRCYNYRAISPLSSNYRSAICVYVMGE